MPDPDWLTHILVAWMLCKLLQLRFKQFDTQNTAIVMVGALVPDIVKIHMLFDLLGVDALHFLRPFHTVVGVLLSSGIISLVFRRPSAAFGLLILGASTHLVLDLLLEFVVGGTPFLFPFTWQEYRLGLIQSDDYRVTLVALGLAGLVYIGSKWLRKFSHCAGRKTY